VDHLSVPGEARSLRPLFIILTVLTALGTGLTGCRASDSSAPPAPALLGRATPAPDQCPAEPTASIVRPLSQRSLQWMGEPVIACGPFAEDEVYRFVAQSPERSSSPVSVRLSRMEGQALLVARQYAWVATADEAQPLSVVTSKVRPIPASEWEALISALRSADFWEMPVEDSSHSSDAVTRWDLEGRLGAGYHHVERQPSTQGPFRDLVRHVLTLAGYADRLMSE
jgi:hypothetical protein